MNIDTDKLNDISGVDPDIIQFNQEIINNIPIESGNNSEVAFSGTSQSPNALWTAGLA